MTALTPNNGWLSPTDFGSEYNAQIFLIWSILAKISSSTLVQVVEVHANSVDIHPLVKMQDGNANTYPHGTIFNCPFFQLQSGISAVIIPPTPGDIGIALFADRDISNVPKNAANISATSDPSQTGVPPGSNRMFDMSDGIYLGGVLNPTPTQFVQFTPTGINITTPTLAIHGNVAITGTLTNNGKNVGSTHEHSGVQTGGSNTGAPI